MFERVRRCGCAVVLEEGCAPTLMTCGRIYPHPVGQTLWLEGSSKLTLGHLIVHVFHGEGDGLHRGVEVEVLVDLSPPCSEMWL